MDPDPYEIIYRGQPALTAAQLARRIGRSVQTTRRAIDRLVAAGAIQAHPEQLDGRTPTYPAAELLAAFSARPGRGANLRDRGTS